MSNISVLTANSYLDWGLLGATPTRLTQIYIGLASAVPTISTPSELSTSTGYYRQPISFAVSSGGTTTSSTGVLFGAFTSSVTLYGVQLWDTVTPATGNMLWFGPLNTPVVVNSPNFLAMLAGAVSASIS